MTMRILIGYDGSESADAALDDLQRAALPREVEALIVSVSDGLVDPSSSIADIAGNALTSRRRRHDSHHERTNRWLHVSPLHRGWHHQHARVPPRDQR